MSKVLPVLRRKLNKDGIRHVFVSGYGFKLHLGLMSSLINNVESLWADIKKAIEEFWNNLES